MEHPLFMQNPGTVSNKRAQTLSSNGSNFDKRPRQHPPKRLLCSRTVSNKGSQNTEVEQGKGDKGNIQIKATVNEKISECFNDCM